MTIFYTENFCTAFLITECFGFSPLKRAFRIKVYEIGNWDELKIHVLRAALLTPVLTLTSEWGIPLGVLNAGRSLSATWTAFSR